MLDIDNIKKNKQEVVDRLCSRGIKREEIEKKINEVLTLSEDRKKNKIEIDSVSREINLKTKEIEHMIKCGKNIDNIKNEVKNLKEKLNIIKGKFEKIEKDLRNILYTIPNIPSKKSCIGRNCEDNYVVFSTQIPDVGGKIPHYEIVKKLDIIDFEIGNKITGSGFPVYKDFGAKLQRALINFFLDEAEKNGFKEYELPIMCNDSSFYGTGQMPDKEKQMYRVEDSFHLIPTAEVPLTNLYRDITIDECDLPIKVTGYTPCFRREAGSWGKQVRGLNRLHQFDKIEIVEIVKQEDSYFTLEEMREYVEGLVKKLGLPYRVLNLCTGDLGFNSAFTYDIEVYSVGQGMWLEASSISNFESYQSNRLNIKYKMKDGRKMLAHTLNGSALALPRIVASLLELNFDGKKINIPDVLKKYLNKMYF